MSIESWFKNKKDAVKKIGKVGLMTAGMFVATEALSQGVDTPNVKGATEQLNTQKIQWATEALSKANHDAGNVQNTQDLHWFETGAVKSFTDHIGPLSNGQEQAAHYSIDDYKKMLKTAKELKNVFTTVEGRVGSTGHTNIDYIIHRLTTMSSVSGFNQQQAVEDFH